MSQPSKAGLQQALEARHDARQGHVPNYVGCLQDARSFQSLLIFHVLTPQKYYPAILSYLGIDKILLNFLVLLNNNTFGSGESIVGPEMRKVKEYGYFQGNSPDRQTIFSGLP
jgi:hypothetical protein